MEQALRYIGDSSTMNQNNSMALLKKHAASLLVLTTMILLTACSRQVAENVPSDFYIMMDVHDADGDTAQNINIRIHANGKVDYDIYETGGVIYYDENDIVRYEKSQIVQDGTFRLTAGELKRLWETIEDNEFFELSDKYQMQIGHSYAFVLIEANGKTHMVDNIGMEVPGMRALVETVATMMPDGIDIEYGEGYVP